jgi:hypothetical protein
MEGAVALVRMREGKQHKGKIHMYLHGMVRSQLVNAFHIFPATVTTYLL